MIVDSKKCYKLVIFTTINDVLVSLHHFSKAPLEIRLGYSKVS